MNKIDIALFTTTKQMTTTELRRIARAIQQQVSRDFAPLWGIDARLHVVSTPPSDHWWIGCFDNSDVAGALGYHDLTSSGLPLGKAFVGTDKQYGYLPSVTLSHEILEMLGDPYINTAVQWDQTTFYAYETCDPVEADADGYDIDGVRVSNFVTPHFFIPTAYGRPYDFLKQLTAPGQVRPGGYQSVYRNGSWSQVNAGFVGLTRAYADIPKVGSRRERRFSNRPMLFSRPK